MAGGVMRGLKAALFASTFLTFLPGAADAAPVAVAFALSLGGSAIAATIAGTALVWSTALATAAVAAVGAGLQMAGQRRAPGPGSREITLNKVQPITEGLILYGERMLGGSITARSVTDTPAGSGGGLAGLKPKKNGRYHAVIPLACHEIEGVQEVWLGEEKVWTAARYAADVGGSGDAWRWGQIDSDYKGKFRLRVYNGTETQEADARYRAAADEWKSTARGRGIAYIYFEADFDPDIYPQGPDQIRARVRGKKVFDPRDGQTRYTSNPALCVRDYALTPEARGGIGWAVSDINDPAIIALANICDELVPLAGGGSDARYAFNGVLDTAISPESNLDRLATSWGGWWTDDRGLLTVGGAAFEIPSFSLDIDMVSGPIKVTARRPFEQQFNQVKAIYADPSQEFTATDLPVLKSETFKAEDNGEDLVRDLGEFPGETSFTRGQRLQKLALLKGRRQKRVEIPCNLAAWGVRIGDVIEVTVPRRGWFNKQFEVERRIVQISPTNVEVRLSMIETSAAIYDWNTSEETAKPAGGASTLPNRLERPIVDAPSVSEALYNTRTGGVKTRVTLTSASENPFVSEWQFRAEAFDQTVAPDDVRNEILRSEEFSLSPWILLLSGGGTFAQSDGFEDPFGGQRATRMELALGPDLGSSSNFSGITQNHGDKNGLLYTRSIWMRSTDGVSSFDVLLEASFANSKVTVTGEWQRFFYTTTSQSNVEILTLRGGFGTSATCDVLVFGAQLEKGDAVTPYQRVGAPGDVTENRFTLLPSGPSPEAVLEDFAPGLYRFAARGRTKLGLTSDWAEALAEIAGLNTPPAPIGGLSAALVSGMVTLRWIQHPDLDVRQGGLIEVRHSADPLATWQTSTSIGKAVPGSATMTTLPAISGVYLMRATDSTGNPGPVSTIKTTAPNFQQLTTLATVTENPTFAGAKSGCAVAGGNLVLNEGQVAADYSFAGAMNFGALRTVRITSELSVIIGDRSDLFDSSELFDSVALFEGAGDAEGDVQVYYRAAIDAAGPFGEWTEFDRTDVAAWRLEFRAELVAASTNFSTEITGLTVVAEGL